MLAAGLVLGGGLALFLRQDPAPIVAAIADQQIDELALLELMVRVENAADIRGPLTYSLDEPPPGAAIDPETGRFTWCPAEDQGPGEYRIAVRVEAGTGESPVETQFRVAVREVERAPIIEPIGNQTVQMDATLVVPVEARDADVPSQPLRFALGPGAPDGAQIDAATGRLEWTPRDAQPGDVVEFTVRVSKAAAERLVADATFRVRVEGSGESMPPGPDFPVDRLILAIRERVHVAEADEPGPHPALSGKARPFAIDGQAVTLFGYENAEAARRDVEGLTRDTLEKFAEGKPERSAYVFCRDRVIAFYVGTDPTLLNVLDSQLGRPALAYVQSAPSPDDDPAEAKPSSQLADVDAVLLELHAKKRLLARPHYPALRKVFADRFAARFADAIESAFGPGDGEMRQWLDAHPDVKEEFYVAIDPEHDDVPRALALFRELKERFPEKFASYANLAIAVAVVWDNEEKAIHHTPRAQHRSTPPEGEMGAVDNFRYFLDVEAAMQGRAQFLPWEFLVHMVNHRTPAKERHWALTQYLAKRAMFGACYGDVPYDGEMLKGVPPKLTDKPHSLPNLRQLGGVCTAQADYAARVGKCLGVPAFSVAGESRYGENHAWVMWVELGPVTRTGFAFSLQSHGRYRGDHYYVGHLHEPHTGRRVTDRQLELRLHTVGMDPVAKRQAELVMRAYPMLREREKMDTTAQFLFLSRLIDFCPGNEEAWMALARMARDGQITKANAKPMMRVLDRLFTTFAALPDFTWVVFDDLVSFQDLPDKRADLFGRLAALYDRAKRPDLACEARLKYAEHLVADDRREEAIQGLATSILAFPEEGNFVPRMLDRMEELADQVDGAGQQVVRFYQQFLPQISPKRGSRASPYCMTMYRRGIQRFKEAGATQLANAYQAQLDVLEAGAR